MEIEKLKSELNEATKGLLMMSETDEPFEFYYDGEHKASELNEDTVRKMAGMPAQYPLKEDELEHFFRNQTRALEDTPEAQERAKRFQDLQEKLQTLLRDVRVYRLGETRITAFILGKTEAGEIAGLKTVLVET